MTDRQAAEARERWESRGPAEQERDARAFVEDLLDAVDALSVRLAQAEQALNDREIYAFGLEDKLERAEVRLREYEEALRREWWLNHGHPYAALYGDDGEMQCSACPCDFKRQPLDEVRAVVFAARSSVAASGGREAPDTKEPPDES